MKRMTLKRIIAVILAVFFVITFAPEREVNAEEMSGQWMESSEGWWYLYEDGSYATGWTMMGGEWYYFDAEGYNHTGWVEIGSDWYYFWPSGQLFTGWLNCGGTWYYMDSDGVMATGWAQIDGSWYLFGVDGDMKKGGWQSMGGYWYYLSDTGEMQTGTITVGGVTYDLGNDGGIVDPTLMKAQGYSSATKYLILIDRSNYQLYVFYGSKGNWSLMKQYDISDGASTPNGEFTMGIKMLSFGEDKGYSCWYASQIQGNYLIHSVGYTPHSQNPSDIIDGRMKVTISHGCIRTSLENAKWIYNNVPSGTKIVIYK